MNVRAERFPLFDGLRAIAAVSVLVYHAAFFASASRLDLTVTQYTAHLDVGVTVFFLISGFLLYRPFVRARLNHEAMPGVAAYGWRRLLRIGPAYWVALTLVALWLPLPYVFHGSGVPIYYGFGQIYVNGDAINGIGQAWTLCVEVTFYAFLPVWALAMRAVARRGDRGRALSMELAGLAALFALSVLYKVWAVHHIAPTSLLSPRFLMPLPNFLDQFAIGMGIAVLSVWYEGRVLPAPLALARRAPAVYWAVALVAFWFVSTQIGFDGNFFQSFSRTMFLERHYLYTIVATALLVPTVFAAPGRSVVGRALASRPLRYLGLISYGIYLYHLAIITKLQHSLHGSLGSGFASHFLVYLALGLASAVAIASASYYLVERPALSLKRLVRPRSPAAAGEAIVEPAPAAPEPVARQA
jgi:peptidoglycan/LPS O-acetylase OafA/YrhL